MTSEFWVKTQIEFAIKAETLEEMKLHLLMILARLELSPLEERREREYSI